MRRTLVAGSLLAALLGGGASAAEDDETAKRAETIAGLVRTVGAQAGIVLYCRALYTVDDTVSEGLSRTVRRALDQALGHDRARAAIAAEGRRVAGEIATLGAERWCADQRDILNTDGVRVFVD
ncbi:MULTISPECIES: hypothetical protein [Methylobacterium]|jgi:hypothetical protein|uniref:UrcA family protein n=1 Tax=Methylobacterium longum TaxID=767694 RepID=A0ABT8AUZ6_9HYPH|nr:MULTISPECIES: hypothetical protein [Methylobacterium]MCJ2098403.1 hypothetical protein [Methylobacterium sp. E-046]MDN3573492.1 hypothetical protein [Methylobacterium longum]GJE10169.1 hypothetical protein FOHLNKBM_1202 [Methylobacterium longum]